MNKIIFRCVVVYKNPSDYPGEYVARDQFTLQNGQVKPGEVIANCKNYLCIERVLNYTGLVKTQLHPNDDPAILEIWV